MTLDLHRFLPYRIDRLSDAVSRHFSDVYRDAHAMARPEWKVFAHLGQEESLTAREIVRRTGLHKTKVSRAVASLEKRRWIARSRDDDDRRIEHLSLTKLGSSHYDRLTDRMREREVGLLEQLSDGEREAVDDALAILERVMKPDR
ncbi:MarR family winged helix-turn-helix transcriptional regulator [Oricola cellulosilytica]|uniref:MarR family transcriptional regulator n=1 Tax=Oricola cellulosilytica TaxID=1429082 RepID=A0A4R0PF15_9HYPH|nr:MarR family transcriptional regulator [Oricola cellulosilytica]TCD14975.1 MarR family transcriptional regulator [Oricola cellulosilytica]